jgi:transcriptional regulator with XRE-family HTH domain
MVMNPFFKIYARSSTVKDYDRKFAAKKIQQWQKDSGLQGQKIAQTVGISAPYYSDIKKGKQRGSIGVLAKIAEVLGRDLNELFSSEKQVEISSIKKTDLQKSLRPLLGRKTNDAVDCLDIWIKAPVGLRKALKAWAEEV